MSSQGPKGQPVGHPILDAIAEACQGQTVEIDEPLEPHARELLRALGVTVLHPDGTRTTPGSEYPSALERARQAVQRIVK